MLDAAMQEWSNASARTYAPAILLLVQSLLGTLADIDFHYERERKRVSRSNQDLNVRIKALERLRVRHREAREPYIKQLAILQQHIRAHVEAG